MCRNQCGFLSTKYTTFHVCSVGTMFQLVDLFMTWSMSRSYKKASQLLFPSLPPHQYLLSLAHFNHCLHSLAECFQSVFSFEHGWSRSRGFISYLGHRSARQAVPFPWKINRQLCCQVRCYPPLGVEGKAALEKIRGLIYERSYDDIMTEMNLHKSWDLFSHKLNYYTMHNTVNLGLFMS